MHDQLSQKFAALADPTRRAMLARLSEGQASVSEIAEPFLSQMSLPAVTKHLKVLERAGLVTKTQDAQRRLCDLNPDGFRETVEYLEEYRRMWVETLDRFGAYLATVTSRDGPAGNRKRGARKAVSGTTSGGKTASGKTGSTKTASGKTASRRTTSAKSTRRKTHGRKS